MANIEVVPVSGITGSGCDADGKNLHISLSLTDEVVRFSFSRLLLPNLLRAIFDADGAAAEIRTKKYGSHLAADAATGVELLRVNGFTVTEATDHTVSQQVVLLQLHIAEKSRLGLALSPQLSISLSEALVTAAENTGSPPPRALN